LVYLALGTTRADAGTLSAERSLSCQSSGASLIGDEWGAVGDTGAATTDWVFGSGVGAGAIVWGAEAQPSANRRARGERRIRMTERDVGSVGRTG
jgi:hypothetical protein